MDVIHYLKNELTNNGHYLSIFSLFCLINIRYLDIKTNEKTTKLNRPFKRSSEVDLIWLKIELDERAKYERSPSLVLFFTLHMKAIENP